MKQMLLLTILLTNLTAMTEECESAIIIATVVHVDYIDGNATLTDSYNAEAIMNKICNQYIKRI